jgi:hypothetical protein
MLPGLDSNGLSGAQMPIRHAILHGVQVCHASEDNSFGAFFTLDVLSWINREEWNPRPRVIPG